MLKFFLFLVVFGGMWQGAVSQLIDTVSVWKNTDDFIARVAEFTKDDNYIVVAGDNTIDVLEVKTGKLLRSIKSPSERRMIRISKDDSLVYSVGSDPLIYVHKISDLSVYKKYSQMDSVFKHDTNLTFTSVSEFFDITKDNKFIAINWENRGFGIYDLEKDSIIYHEQIKEITGEGLCYKLKFFQNDNKLAVATNDGVLLYNTKTFKLDRTIGKTTYGKVMDFDITPDETKIVTLDIKGETLIWDLQTGEKLFLCPLGFYLNLKIFNNNYFWTCTYSTRGIQIWDMKSNKIAQSFSYHFGNFYNWSNNRKYTFMAGEDAYYLINNDKLLSIIDFEKRTSIELFPNPATGLISLYYEKSNDGNLSYKISDITGKIVESKELGFFVSGMHSISIDVSQIRMGTYFLSIISNSKIVTYKFLKGN